MFTLLFILSHQVQSCSTQCQDLCLSKSFSSSCLESCACPSSLSSYSWHCAQETTTQCEKSPNFETCMLSSNCRLTQILGKSPESTSENSKTIENNEKLENLAKPSQQSQTFNDKSIKQVTCADCKIFQGDDYWECVAEYCESNSIEFSLCPNCEKQSKSQKSSNFESKISFDCESCESSDSDSTKICPTECKSSPQELKSIETLEFDETAKINLKIKNKPTKPSKPQNCTKECTTTCEGDTCYESCTTVCGNSSFDAFFMFKIFTFVVFAVLLGELGFGVFLILKEKREGEFKGEYKLIT